MITVRVLRTHAAAMTSEVLTSGRGGLRAKFQFSDDWDGLVKTAIFEAGDIKKDALLVDDQCIVPHECMISGAELMVGVYGAAADESIVIPTVYALVGTVSQGADPSGDESYPATPDMVAQLQQTILADVDERLTEYAKTAEMNAAVSAHNTNTAAHADLRAALQALAQRINAVLDSDDETLDELSEIVAYIKSNKTLIEAITTSKVSVADIIDDLTTNASNKPLSAAQGVALKAMIDAIATTGAGAHNAICRGKHLGDIVTDAQWATIQAGMFEDLYVGDYWEIDGFIYRIAGFNYYYGTGDNSGVGVCRKHHATIVPDFSMYDSAMNDTNTTAGAYACTKMKASGLVQAKNRIIRAFGEEHLLMHRKAIPNATTNGYESGFSWYTNTLDLMTEHNVYGGKIFRNARQGSEYASYCTIDKSQYPLFAFRPDLISNGQAFWLRDVISATYFANVNSSGIASGAPASTNLGVRPAFSIC